MCTENTYKLDDQTISYIAKNLQLCILTGTDIVDHLRMMEITPDANGNLIPTDNYIQLFKNNEASLLARATELAAQLQAEQGTSDTTDSVDQTGDTPFQL